MGARDGGDTGGREFERVADALRARMVDGVYPVGFLVPAQRRLAEDFGVSRDTVQKVIKELKREGWIETKQGSGTRVVRTQQIHSPTGSGRPVTLGPLINQAFERPDVTLDVFTLTSESLDAHIRDQADRIRAGEIAPRSIRLRMLLPSPDHPLPYWRHPDPGVDRALRRRLLDITERHTASLRATLKNLPAADLEIRHVPVGPTVKVYVLNGTAVLHGYYQRYDRVIELEDGREVRTKDVIGMGAGLTHYVTSDDPHAQGTVFVAQTRAWFDSFWERESG
ncbi:GntR family transcriptional regulator [Streptomyces sp. NPDC000134]|uniref:GntR family transcriptional regulator n=1 Tax=Streptomyces sp. NPDC000134 TaxID=3364536 RepID=UPI0036A8CE3A